MNEFIITFRETLEATLIIGIFYTLFTKIHNKQAIKVLWKAVVYAILASVIFAFILIGIKERLNNSVYEKLFEALLMYLAAGFLLYMVIWMHKNVNIKEEFEEKANLSLKKLNYTSIFFLIFFAITREGFETVLFLIGGVRSNEFSYLGFFVGITMAVAIGYLIFVRGKQIAMKPFFRITSILLVFFAAGMIAYGTHEMEEYLVKTKNVSEEKITRVWDILPPLIEKPNNTTFYNFNADKNKYYHMFHDKGNIGSFLKGFFGYNSDPNYLEFTLWLGTLIISFYFLFKTIK